MSFFNKRWRIVKERNPKLQELLSKELNLTPIVSQILINRGIKDLDSAWYFFNASLKDIYSPFLMKDMDKAVERIIKAIYMDEHICIYGDYDVDGITGTALLLHFLKRAGANVTYYLPHRLNEGYGLNCEAINNIKQKGVTLLITVDCGITNNKEIAFR